MDIQITNNGEKNTLRIIDKNSAEKCIATIKECLKDEQQFFTFDDGKFCTIYPSKYLQNSLIKYNI